MNRLPVTDADIHAYADRQLPPERAAEVDEAAARNPALAARLAEIRAQNEHLRAAFDPMLDEPPPQRLLDAARRPPRSEPRQGSRQEPRQESRQGSRHRSWFAPLWAAAATLVIGTGIGWFSHGALIERAGMPINFVQEVAYAHLLYASDPNRPVEIWAPEEKRLVAWLSKRLDFPLHAPDLNAAGYALVGGRLVAGNQRPTAMFMYENAGKQRLTLQVRVVSGVDETAFRYQVADGVGVFYWVGDHCAYALSGNFDRSQLLKVGELVYDQLATADDAKTDARR